jgi:hypothetical protein
LSGLCGDLHNREKCAAKLTATGKGFIYFLSPTVDILFILYAFKSVCLDYVLFCIYLFLGCWLVTRISFFKTSGLGKRLLLILFLLKIIASIIYGWQGIRYSYLIQMGDTWRWHFYSLEELALLKTEPLSFFTDFANNYNNSYSGFFSSYSWWNDLHTYAFTKLLTVFNLFSNGSYFINTIFYSLLTFYGPVAVFKMMQHAFPGKKMLQVFCVFLMPSFLYWSSGIHKDGLAFLGMALVIYHCYFSYYRASFRLRDALGTLFGLLLLLLYRNYLLIVLLPALLAWFVAEWRKRKAWLTFLIAYGIYGVFFFGLPHLSAHLDLPKAVAEKQKDFLTLKGNSFVPVKKLEPTLGSFVKNAPYALKITLLRPFPSDAKHLFSFVAAAENLLFLMLLIAAFLFWKKEIPVPAFVWFCVFLSLSVLLIVGYTVNFLGAIVRYRSIVLPFLLTPILSQANWRGKRI